MHTIILLLAPFFFAATVIAQTPTPIAVIADKGTHADHVQTLVEQELQKSGRFFLVERERVEDVIKEISFQQSGITAQDKALEIGHHLNVKLLVFLQTHRIGIQYQLSLKVIDVGTNQVLRVDSQHLGNTAKDIERGSRLAARRLVAHAGLFSPAEMVHIAAGQFSMGAENGLPDEHPVHTVHLSPFAIDRYEVSHIAVEEWRVAQGRKGQADLRSADLPATNISWEDAVAYCGERGARLPTEAEWEYVARGSDSRPYPWGTAVPTPSRARFGGQERTPLPVRHLLQGATPEGVHHLAGNVAEWVQDWWSPSYYSESPAQDPRGPEAGDYRSVRGGSWNQPTDEIRASARAYHNPYKGASHIGFRCARDATDAQNRY